MQLFPKLTGQCIKAYQCYQLGLRTKHDLNTGKPPVLLKISQADSHFLFLCLLLRLLIATAAPWGFKEA